MPAGERLSPDQGLRPGEVQALDATAQRMEIYRSLYARGIRAQTGGRRAEQIGRRSATRIWQPRAATAAVDIRGRQGRSLKMINQASKVSD
jgi:hypothetical protein